ncbi:hypothetical protein [Microbulbifer thermotolerans]|uniref:Uncharacterized protein n=1 Tax=Microbulbifer thermotolerans TaxID=252514 RepID=A0A143HMY5_MICTH|nr:hypothetical protein [Microbulbifer thermotolerans]AMX03059.1 hypothetical protein A3224_11215 [Microbulbifer thermotolerans]MCX2802055.1 hypothetical protein [Microbulbifer thermotolerans]
MSRRKNKYKQRGHQPGPSSELLDELNTLRDLLGSDELGDIPLLDQVAGPVPSRQSAARTPKPQPLRPASRRPLEEIDLPILFSPVDEELPDDGKPELNESELELLRPLQNLRPESGAPLTESSTAPAAAAPREREDPPSPPAAHLQKQSAAGDAAQSAEEQGQGELFVQTKTPSKENPFLPAHIRARLTGGRVPKTVEPTPEAPATATSPAEEVSAESTGPKANAAAEPQEPAPLLPQAGKDAQPADKEIQRKQLVDRLVAKQLPELERQLRARIEKMLDELEAKQ